MVQQAYDLHQRAPWSKELLGDKNALIAAVKARSASAAQVPASPSELAAVKTLAAGFGQASSGGAPGKMTTVIGRSLATAALITLGALEDTATEGLLSDPECASCLRMAKLDLFQCLAVAKPFYEHVFCTGQHAIADPGECIAASSGTFKPRVREVETAPSSK